MQYDYIILCASWNAASYQNRTKQNTSMKFSSLLKKFNYLRCSSNFHEKYPFLYKSYLSITKHICVYFSGSYMSWIPMVGAIFSMLVGGMIADHVVTKHGPHGRVFVIVFSLVSSQSNYWQECSILSSWFSFQVSFINTVKYEPLG